jgi:hypothetical protein
LPQATRNPVNPVDPVKKTKIPTESNSAMGFKVAGFRLRSSSYCATRKVQGCCHLSSQNESNSLPLPQATRKNRVIREIRAKNQNLRYLRFLCVDNLKPAPSKKLLEIFPIIL